VLGTDRASVYGGSGSRFAEGIVTAVEVLALLEVLGEVIGLGGEFTVETEETLLIWRERLDVDLVLLVGVHFELIVGVIGEGSSLIFISGSSCVLCKQRVLEEGAFYIDSGSNLRCQSKSNLVNIRC